MHKSVALFSLIAWLALPSHASPAEIGKDWKRNMGCDAYGPLSSTQTVESENCVPGQTYNCQVTDSSGCDKGDPSNIESLVVRDPSDAGSLAGSASVSEAPFTCPPTGMVSCSVIFTSDGASKADHYGLRIVQSSD